MLRFRGINRGITPNAVLNRALPGAHEAWLLRDWVGLSYGKYAFYSSMLAVSVPFSNHPLAAKQDHGRCDRISLNPTPCCPLKEVRPADSYA